MFRIICVSAVLLLSMALQGQPYTYDQVRTMVNDARIAVRQAEGEVRTAEQTLTDAADRKTEMLAEWNANQERLKFFDQKISSVQNAIEAGLEHVIKEIARYQAIVESSSASEAEKADAARYVLAYTNMRNRRQANDPRNDLKAAWERRKAVVIRQQEALSPRLQQLMDEVRQLEQRLRERNKALAEANKKLADVMLKAPEWLAHLNPPHLHTVEAKKGGSVKYRGVWHSQEELVDEHIKVVRKGIEEQQQHLDELQAAVNAGCDALLAQNRIAQAAIDAYVVEVKYRGWIKMSLADMLDAGISILRNYKEMGPWAFAYEAAFRVGNAAMGRNGLPGYDVTQLPGAPNAPIDLSATAGRAAETVVVDQVKGQVLNLVKTYVKASPFSIDNTLSYGVEADNRVWRGSVSKTVSEMRNLVNNGRFWVCAEKTNLSQWMASVTDPGSTSTGLKKLYETLARNPSAVWDKLKGSFDRKMGMNALGDLVQSTGIQALKEWMDQTRLELWSKYLMEDMKRESLRKALTAMGAKKRTQEVVMKGLAAALEELIKEKENLASNPARFLKVEKDQVLQGTGSFTLVLTFSGPIDVESVTLGSKTITGTSNEQIWEGSFDLTDMGEAEMATLTVKAKGSLDQKKIDNPITAALFAGTANTWRGYEPIDDAYHKMKLKPLKDGTSFVLLIDCSGSMGENGRLASARAACENVLSSDELKANDEVAIMTFSRCGAIGILQPFTSDFGLVRERLASLGASGGTPLAAAMMRASAYIESASRNENRKIILLTDGEESCDGNEFLAMQAVRRYRHQIRRHLF